MESVSRCRAESSRKWISRFQKRARKIPSAGEWEDQNEYRIKKKLKKLTHTWFSSLHGDAPHPEKTILLVLSTYDPTLWFIPSNADESHKSSINLQCVWCAFSKLKLIYHRKWTGAIRVRFTKLGKLPCGNKLEVELKGVSCAAAETLNLHWFTNVDATRLFLQ